MSIREPPAAPRRWERHGPRPSLRGRIHQVAAPLAAVLVVPLVLAADPGPARVGSAVFGVALCALFATSAAYHRIEWSPPWVRRMKRADHIAIFALIAGTYTPIALVVLQGWMRPVVLAGAWGAVLGGAAAAALGAFERRGAANAAYITFGWLAVLVAPRLLAALSVLELVLIAAGGIVYTLGAIGLALRRPDPNPRVFGYHEVWHTQTVVAAACHALAVWSITT